MSRPSQAVTAAPAVAPARKQVLFLAKLFPWPLTSGARQRAFHLARAIAARHDVWMIVHDAPPSHGALEAFKQASGCRHVEFVSRLDPATALRAGPLGRKLRSVRARLASVPEFVQVNWTPALVAAIRRLVALHPVDVVFATQSWMAEHARAAGIGPVIVDLDDVLSIMSRQVLAVSSWRVRTPLAYLDAAKDRFYERLLPSRFAHVVVAKAEDRSFFRVKDRDRTSVVENGTFIAVDPIPEPAIADTLIFIGTLGHEPNVDAIRWFAAEVLPPIWAARPDVRFIVAGFGSGEEVRDVLADPRCTLYESPPDLTPLYARASVVVAPVRLGGGTRIKILEALAYGRATVSTRFAAEGLGLLDGQDLEFADTAESMAARCLDLLGDRDRRLTLAATGRAHVARRFDWARITAGVPDLVAEISDAAPRS
jgi:glycosyltransferase involved in cell wall biosynthesis